MSLLRPHHALLQNLLNEASSNPVMDLHTHSLVSSHSIALTVSVFTLSVSHALSLLFPPASLQTRISELLSARDTARKTALQATSRSEADSLMDELRARRQVRPPQKERPHHEPPRSQGPARERAAFGDWECPTCGAGIIMHDQARTDCAYWYVVWLVPLVRIPKYH